MLVEVVVVIILLVVVQVLVRVEMVEVVLDKQTILVLELVEPPTLEEEEELEETHLLELGLVDQECCIHISPIILGSGIRLFDNIDKDIYKVEINEVIPSALTTHLKYKLIGK